MIQKIFISRWKFSGTKRMFLYFAMAVVAIVVIVVPYASVYGKSVLSVLGFAPPVFCSGAARISKFFSGMPKISKKIFSGMDFQFFADWAQTLVCTVFNVKYFSWGIDANKFWSVF